MTNSSPLKDQLRRTLKVVDQWHRGISPLVQPRAEELLILKYAGLLHEHLDELTPAGRKFLRDQ